MVRITPFIASLLLAQVTSAAVCGTEEQCNQACKKYGKSYICRKYSPERQSCTGCEDFQCMTPEERPYRDPTTGMMDCCPGGTHFEFDKGIKHGECCEDGKFLSVDSTNKVAGCCPEGEPKHALFVDPVTLQSSCCEATALGFSDGKCVMPPNPGPGPDPTPKPKPEECGHKVCPPDEHDMGIEYGKCYRLISVATGFPLSLPGGDYRVTENDLSPIWQFRVCRSTKNCSPGGTVKADEKFVLNDVIGKAGDGPWWVCSGAHYRPCQDEKSVKEFTAKKWCTSDGCGICLAADPKGIGRVCPGQSALGDNSNPRQCVPFIVEEMTCLANNDLDTPSIKRVALSFGLDDEDEWESEL